MTSRDMTPQDTETAEPMTVPIAEEDRFYVGLRIRYGAEREVVVLHGSADVVRAAMKEANDEHNPIYLLEAVEVQKPTPHPDRPYRI